MEQRRGFIPLDNFNPQKDSQGNKLCLNCSKMITTKRRRKYCSEDCAYEFFANHNHSVMRNWLVDKRGAICEKCGKKLTEKNNNISWIKWEDIIIDHKIPIALGGEEFGEENLWILCQKCNKEKTKQDVKHIAEKRKEERLLSKGQKILFKKKLEESK